MWRSCLLFTACDLLVAAFGCAGGARVELAAAESLDLIRESLAQSLSEYHADLAREDDERQQAAIQAFIARARADAADEQAQAHAAAFAAALDQIDADRQVAWARYNTTLDNLAILRETGDGLRRLAIESLSIEDETKRYLTDLLAKAAQPRRDAPSRARSKRMGKPRSRTTAAQFGHETTTDRRNEMKDKNANKAAADLEALLQQLQERLERSGKDAIDAVLRPTPRTTAVRSLRDHAVVQRFRAELTDGLIRVDTAQQLLAMIRVVLEAALKP